MAIDSCHSFHFKITLQYYFSSEKGNGDTHAKKFVIILTVTTVFIWVKRMRKTDRILDDSQSCKKDVAAVRMRMRNVSGAVDVLTRSVLSIPSGKILDKFCESLYWW